MKAITKSDLSESEIIGLTAKGEDSKDYVAFDIVAMGLELQPQILKVKDSEDSDTHHHCLLAVMPFPLPIDKKILQQNQLIVPNMSANSPIQKALGDIPYIRIVVKKESVVESLK